MDKSLQDLRVKIFADGADKAGMLSLNANPVIRGMTTNPSLMRKAGIQNYEAFARTSSRRLLPSQSPLRSSPTNFPNAPAGAEDRVLARNVYVKIPITNTRGESALPVVRQLAGEGVQLNITAILTLDQVRRLRKR